MNSIFTTTEYPRQTPGAFAVNRRKLSWLGHVYRHDMLLKITPQGTVDGSRHKGRTP